ncbi:hypothetical protein SEA_JENOS_9 [Microbacterium phage Jenos]|nr:hypothetical protein SEA_JENOS_9 [Microbacterium phage Jenos]
MSDAQETPEVVEVEPVHNIRNSQAVYDAARKERKAKAAVVVEANAKLAKQKRDKALGKRNVSLGQREALSGAAAIEKRINERAAAKLKGDETP